MRDTIDMAREAGFEQVDQDVDEWICFTDEIERFEALVRADERKQVALNKKAENARELGLDYEPVLKDNSNYRYDPPVAEPVAWDEPTPDFYISELSRNTIRFHNAVHGKMDFSKQKMGDCIVSVYTTPPAAQRQWVGLTDEEVSQLIGGMPHGKMVRAIEAKLKEKNAAAQPAVPDAFGTREGEHPQYIQGWNDCRAEMLRGNT